MNVWELIAAVRTNFPSEEGFCLPEVEMVPGQLNTVMATVSRTLIKDPHLRREPFVEARATFGVSMSQSMSDEAIVKRIVAGAEACKNLLRKVTYASEVPETARFLKCEVWPCVGEEASL